jgi:hypothetical protein
MDENGTRRRSSRKRGFVPPPPDADMAAAGDKSDLLNVNSKESPTEISKAVADEFSGDGESKMIDMVSTNNSLNRPGDPVDPAASQDSAQSSTDEDNIAREKRRHFTRSRMPRQIQQEPPKNGMKPVSLNPSYSINKLQPHSF